LGGQPCQGQYDRARSRVGSGFIGHAKIKEYCDQKEDGARNKSYVIWNPNHVAPAHKDVVSEFNIANPTCGDVAGCQEHPFRSADPRTESNAERCWRNVMGRPSMTFHGREVVL
jgi:hypothetical protein